MDNTSTVASDASSSSDSSDEVPYPQFSSMPCHQPGDQPNPSNTEAEKSLDNVYEAVADFIKELKSEA